MGSLKVPSPDCGKNVGALPSQTSLFSDVKCTLWKRALWYWRMIIIFSLDACHQVDITTSGASQWRANCIDNSFSGHESTNMHASASQETFFFHKFSRQGCGCGLLLLLWRCSRMPFHSLLVSFFFVLLKWWNHLSSLGMKFGGKSSLAAYYHLSNCNDTSMHALVCSSTHSQEKPMTTYSPAFQSLYHFLLSCTTICLPITLQSLWVHQLSV